MFDKALDSPFPRVDLNEVYQRVRTVLAQLEQVKTRHKDAIVSDKQQRRALLRELGPLVQVTPLPVDHPKYIPFHFP